MVTVLQTSVEERCVELYRRAHQVAFATDQRMTRATYAPPVLHSFGTGQRHDLFLDGQSHGYRQYWGYNQFYVSDSVVLGALFRGGAKPSLSEDYVAYLYEFQMRAVFERAAVARLPFGRSQIVTRSFPDYTKPPQGLVFIGFPLASGTYDQRWVEFVLRDDPYLVRGVRLDPEEHLRKSLRLPDWGDTLAYLQLTFVRPDLDPSRPGSEGGEAR